MAEFLCSLIGRLFAYSFLGALSAGARTDIPTPYVALSSYSDVTCDGMPEYVTVHSQGNMTHLSYDKTNIEIPGYATDVEFQSDRVVLHVDTTEDGEPDHSVTYRDCSKASKTNERGAAGNVDVECDGKFEKVHLKSNRLRNQTILEVYNDDGLLRYIILNGYAIGAIAITPEEFLLNLDTNNDGIADESYGHECPETPNLPYVNPKDEEKKESTRI